MFLGRLKIFKKMKDAEVSVRKRDLGLEYIRIAKIKLFFHPEILVIKCFPNYKGKTVIEC